MAQALISGDTLAQMDVYRAKAKQDGGLVLIVEESRAGQMNPARYLAVQKEGALYRRDTLTGNWMKFTRDDVEKGGVKMVKWYLDFERPKTKELTWNFMNVRKELNLLTEEFLHEIAKRVPPGFLDQKASKTGQIAEPTETLQFGSQGAQVRWWQIKLKAMDITDAEGNGLKPDGDFGRRTQEATEKLQRALGLKPTGVADDKTQEGLKRMLVGELPPKQIEQKRTAGQAVRVVGAREVFWPVAGTDTKLFNGGHEDPYTYVEEHRKTVIAADYAFGARHPGIDLFAPERTPIIAPVSGTVRAAGAGGPKGGYRVWIEGNDGNWYYMAHMYGDPSEFAASGTAVTGGVTQIGEVGKTGSARGTCAHVHFEIHVGSRGGKALNPHEVVGTDF